MHNGRRNERKVKPLLPTQDKKKNLTWHWPTYFQKIIKHLKRTKY